MKDIYVEFKGSDIKGDSRDQKHKDTVEVYSWSHLIRQPKSATASSSGGHTAERCEHGEMVFTKDIDGSSPKLWQACSSGIVVNDVVVYFYRAFGGKNNTGSPGSTQNRHQYLKIELKNAIVASVSPVVSSEGIPQETFTLKYSAVKWTYDELNIDGNKSGKVNIQGAWNLAKNTPNLT
ncbi:Hcp family type VI secretion system effector [Cognatazoarcus halotolerans]|uniref:Hcp family type VI secretion system effector n=1 Tax=Cognatazoarcus halotolerans TaxID=2686016 RepID=UPI00135C9BE9|nr:type VI secretion system tube protein Hcp [Cognatazoarcus halotolerans]MBX3680512.1 type VI secretion system tube protein Hcp [Rhodocyclaceae bacterium]MCB1897882.1 type VI secretion system tube protein Hcp [Rhodocyclaceae bacterium]MCP5311218.1 type VI secretion system tube protein Hcp [Zoogloeaceae bacterium]